jgi:predicted ribosomally synthesized peptide with nif11-like leader
MSIAEIERFAADLRSNDALRAEADKAQAKTPVVAFAASKGYAFTTDDVKQHIRATAKAAGRELTDAELDGVAGAVGRWWRAKRLTLSGRTSFTAPKSMPDVGGAILDMSETRNANFLTVDFLNFFRIRDTPSIQLVGCSTGRSAGFLPLKIRSTYSAARQRTGVGRQDLSLLLGPLTAS